MPDRTIKDYPIAKDIDLRHKNYYEPNKCCEMCNNVLKTQGNYTRSYYKCTHKKSPYRTRLYFVCNNFKARPKKKG